MGYKLQKYIVKVSPLVKQQLREIYTYVAVNLKSPLAANHLNDLIKSKIMSL